MKRSVVIVSGVSLALAGLFGLALYKQIKTGEFLANLPEPVLTVNAKAVEQQDWAHTISSTGRLEAVNGVDVSAEVSGRVTEILFSAGQQVKEGVSLIKLDASVEEAKLASAQAQVRLNALTEERYRRLRKTNAASQASLDEAVANLTMARANVTQYSREIEKRDIKAPFDGEIGIGQIDIGEYIQPGQKIATLQDLTAMDLQFTVSQRFLPELKVGATVDVEVDSYPKKVFKGTLTAIDPKVDDKSGLIALKAHVPNPDGLLRPGMYAKAGINLAPEKDQLIVPQSAVSYSLYGSFIYVIREDDKAAQRVYQVMVDVLDRSDNLAVVKGELSDGDMVVTAGGVRLSNGSQVKIAQQDILEAKPAIDKD
jgi:membrane fusion protein (multidrug efflux system)